MSRLSRLTLLVLVLPWAGGGCAADRCCPDCGFWGLAGLRLSDTETLPGPGTIEVDVPAPEAVEDALGGEASEPACYYSITPHECQCLAVHQSAMANALDEESLLSAGRSGDCKTPKMRGADLQSRLIAYQAIAERNTAAANALRLYYRLAEAEAARDLLDSSLVQIDRAIEDYEQLTARGMQIPLDGQALHRQRDELLDRRAQLELSVVELNSGLRVLLGAESGDETAIWPAADLEVAVAPVDVEGVVAQGLATDTELLAMGLVAKTVATECLPIVRAAMAQINPMLGSSPPRDGPLAKLFGIAQGQHERAVRCQQIAELLAQKQRAVEQQIRRQSAAIEARFRQIALASKQRDNRRDRLDDLKARRKADGVSAFDVSEAQIQLYQAEADLIAQVVAWKIAEVDLKETIGVLPVECGFQLPDDCCACECQ